MKRIVFSILILSLGVVRAEATNFYTSSTGNDSGNNCQTIGTPCNLANGFANEIAQVTAGNGDILYLCYAACDGAGSVTITTTSVLDGAGVTIPSGTTMNNALRIQPYCSGSACETITFQPSSGSLAMRLYRNSYVIIDGCPAATSDATCTQHIILDGVNLTDNATAVLELNGVDHVLVKGVEVKNGYWTGVSPDTNDTNYWVNNVELRWMKVHDNGRCMSPCDPAHGVYFAGVGTNGQGQATENVIDGGEYYNNAGWNGNSSALTCYQPEGDTYSGITIRNAIIHDNNSGIGWSAGCPNGLFYNNVIYNNNTGPGGIGIAVASEGGYKLYNNTIYGHDDGGGGDGLGIRIDGAVVAEAKNNIVYGNTVAQLSIINSGSLTACATNIGITAGCANESSPADPLFAGATNFHILAGSPAIDTGTNLSGEGFTTDKDGAQRGTTWDKGAYEATTAGPGYPLKNIFTSTVIR